MFFPLRCTLTLKSSLCFALWIPPVCDVVFSDGCAELGAQELKVLQCANAQMWVLEWKTAVIALETRSRHSRKLFDKAEACDHFLSVYFGDLRHISCIPFLPTFCPIHLPAAIFASSSVKTRKVHNCCLLPQKEGEKNRDLGDVIYLYFLYLTGLDCLRWWTLTLSLNFNICTSSWSVGRKLQWWAGAPPGILGPVKKVHIGPHHWRPLCAKMNLPK